MATNAQGWTIAVDGKVLPLHNANFAVDRVNEHFPLYVGASYSQYEADTDVWERVYDVARSGTKYGKIMVYSGDIGINRIIQNYVATREGYNRHSGEKNPYFVEGEDTFTF